jgi:hypothetical protein
MELRSFIKRTIREYLSEERFLSENVLDSKINKVTETEEFKKWFDGSKVVDDNQNPLVVYHGASSTFKDFKSSFDGVIFNNLYEFGIKSNVYIVYDNNQIKKINL